MTHFWKDRSILKLAHYVTESKTRVGMVKELAGASEEGTSTLIHSSTSEVYGNTEVIPTPETYYGRTNPVGLRSGYDEGKRFAVALCMAYFRQHNVNVKLPRIFNSYGLRIRDDGLNGRALPRFILQALCNEPLTIYGDGKQTRSFSYLSDTIRGILKLTLSMSDSLVVNIALSSYESLTNKPIWITETGMPSNNASTVPSPGNTPEKQAVYLDQMYTFLMSKHYVRAIMWFSTFGSSNPKQYDFGLFNSTSLAPKPAMAHLENFVRLENGTVSSTS